MPSCRPSEPVRLAIAFSRPGPAWNDDEAAASSSNDDVSWNSANHAPSPTAGRATSAINVEFSLGSPIRRVMARATIDTVRVAASTNVSHSVARPKRSRPRSSSCPSCAIADDGASTPVASAIARECKEDRPRRRAACATYRGVSDLVRCEQTQDDDWDR